MSAVWKDIGQVYGERVIFPHGQHAGKRLREFFQRGQAAAVAFDRDDFGASLEKSACQAAGAWADFINGLSRQIAGDSRDPVQQLAIEQEVLAERLARREPVARDNFT